jgi:cytochrome c
MTCHAIDKKVVGPAFKDVAAKYAGQKDAEAKLATKILKGGSGTWGAVPMPANTQVSDTESHVLAKWVLTQK